MNASHYPPVKQIDILIAMPSYTMYFTGSSPLFYVNNSKTCSLITVKF